MIGADINKINHEKIGALALATMRGNRSLVEFLADKNANIVDKFGYSIGHVFAYKNECDAACLTFLIDNYGHEDLLMRETEIGITPLHLCVDNRSHKFMRALIECENIDCNCWLRLLYSTTRFGMSPLAMAISYQNYEFIQQLIGLWHAKFEATHCSDEAKSFYKWQPESNHHNFHKGTFHFRNTILILKLNVS